MPRRRCAHAEPLARDREPRRHVDPDRVPRALGARRGRRLDAERGAEGVPPRRAPAAAARADPLRPPRRAARPGRAASPSSRARRSAQRRAAPARARAARRPDRARPRDRGRAGRAPALPRLHARQARPLLRQVRAAALRRRARAGRGGLGLAVDRTSAATASRATSSRCPDGVYYGRVEPSEAWPVVEAALDGRVHLPLLPRPLVPRLRRAGGRAAPCARRRACSASQTCACGRSSATASGWRAEVEAGGTVYEVDVRTRGGRADAPHVLDASR